MDNARLSLLTVLPGLLLVLLLVLLVLMVVTRRRRARDTPPVPVAMPDVVDGRAIVDALNVPDSEAVVAVVRVEAPDGEDGKEAEGSDDQEKSSDALVFRDQRRFVDSVRSSARRPEGRHLAVLPAQPGGPLLLLVPSAVKRLRRPPGGSPRPASASTPAESVGDVAVLEDPVDRESDTAAIAAAPSSAVDSGGRDAAFAADRDIDTYRRRVDATIRAISRRIGPGESPELVEARMLAAVDRLDGPLGFARPRLSPVGPRRPLGQPGHTLQTALPAPPGALQSGQPVAEQRPVADVPPEADPVRTSENAFQAEGPESEGVQPEGTAREAREVVLPVPPPPSSNNTPRRGLRRGGKVA